MHPAKSVIFFTTISGAGYGLLFVSIMGLFSGLYKADLTILLTTQWVAFILIISGLISSTFHLGHPERAWRALSQWKTSWLSREGLSAIVTFIPWLGFIVSKISLESDLLSLWFGIVTAILAIFTVYTTSMIYRSLRAVHAWYNRYVSPVYILFSLTSGLVILNVITTLASAHSDSVVKVTVVSLIGSLLLKRAYWRTITRKGITTLESATGLGVKGRVKLLEPPHHGDNYLLKEMGFQIARKHSHKLRTIFTLSWVMTILCLGLSFFLSIHWLNLLAIISILTSGVAIVIERWLFFAEAKHTQALYYGH